LFKLQLKMSGVFFLRHTVYYIHVQYGRMLGGKMTISAQLQYSL